jgi:putative SOS response-associated peptidase YedK
VAPIIRTIDGVRNEGDLVQRRWSWPGQYKRPVYNFRSEGREFTSGRCLIVADGFMNSPTRRTRRRSGRTSGSSRNGTSRSSASRGRDTPEVGEAFTMLTMAPGPDIEPYHDRQIVILERDAWADWLDPAKSLIKSLQAAALRIEQVG